ncbi:MAG TPA: (d)CMP kinase [Streptosporangiaceae bacterium]|nr:(d)CMP kinase [Streptosporangiaceae bacterium]
MVIAVDGPSGSGKSTAARGAATALGLRYLDTGAMYRALTWWMLEHDIDISDADSVVKHGVRLPMEVGTDPAGQYVCVDGTDVTTQIRSRRVSNAVSLVASIPQIRGHLVAMQQQIVRQARDESGGIVAEGRDIGTVVAPEAAVKVFLTASEQTRAVRRSAELAGQPGPAGAGPGTELTLREQAKRDHLDAPQTQRAGDAVEIDATELSLDEVIGLIVSLASARRVTP